MIITKAARTGGSSKATSLASLTINKTKAEKATVAWSATQGAKTKQQQYHAQKKTEKNLNHHRKPWNPKGL